MTSTSPITVYFSMNTPASAVNYDKSITVQPGTVGVIVVPYANSPYFYATVSSSGQNTDVNITTYVGGKGN